MFRNRSGAQDSLDQSAPVRCPASVRQPRAAVRNMMGVSPGSRRPAPARFAGFAAVCVLLVKKVAQRSLPLTAVAAGLPQTRGVLAEAASYSERMFETRTVGA